MSGWEPAHTPTRKVITLMIIFYFNIEVVALVSSQFFRLKK